MQTSIDVTDKSPEWQSRLNSKNTEDLLQLAVPNGFTGPRSSIFPLTSSDECGRVFNFVGNVNLRLHSACRPPQESLTKKIARLATPFSSLDLSWAATRSSEPT